MNVGQLRKIINNPELDDEDIVLLEAPGKLLVYTYPEFTSVLENETNLPVEIQDGVELPIEKLPLIKNAIVFRNL